MGEREERIAREFHRAYEARAADHGYETRPESAVPWEDVPAQNRELMLAVVGELLERGVIEPGTPPGQADPEWRNAFGRVQGEDALALLREFGEAGMGWLANRVLHPFGWSLGVVQDDEGAPLGIGLQKTSDAEGIVSPNDVEVDARRQFLGAVGRELPPPAEPEPGKLPTACPSCGWRRYRVDAGGFSLPPSEEAVSYVQPHFLGGVAVRLACANPRCAAYEPMVRAPGEA